MFKKFVGIAAVAVGILFAQEVKAQDVVSQIEVTRSAVQTIKKDIVAQTMNLSAEQALYFWPIYDQFQAAKQNLNTQLFVLLESYAVSYDTMSDAQASAMTKAFLDLKAERDKLYKHYFKKFSKVLPGLVVARYFQLEQKLEAVVMYDLAGEIPLAK